MDLKKNNNQDDPYFHTQEDKLKEKRKKQNLVCSCICDSKLKFVYVCMCFWAHMHMLCVWQTGAGDIRNDESLEHTFLEKNL